MNLLRKLLGGGSASTRDYVERRKQQRVRVKESLLCVLESEGTLPAFLHDVSLTGLRLRLQTKLREGQEVTFLAEEKERKIIGATSKTTEAQSFRFRGRVIWARRENGQTDFEAGVVFTEPVHAQRDLWLKLMMKNAGITTSLERRRHYRAKSDLGFTFRTDSGYQGDGTLFDIGVGGMRGTVAFDLPVGAVVSLEIPARYSTPAVHDLQGRVVRQKKKGAREWEVAMAFGELSPQRMADLGRLMDYLLKH